MVKTKKVEVTTEENEVMNEIPQTTVKEEPTGPINCLRNERIELRFVPSPNAMIRTKGHINSGGMSENAEWSYVVPVYSNHQYVNVLTNNEKEYLEKAMGLELGALSVYRKDNNFWDSSNSKGIGRIVLKKRGNFFDLSNPIDYIKYKVLLANKDKIASSIQELEERPKATYEFVVISENAETALNLSKMEATKRCYMEYGKIENDNDTLRVIIEAFEGRPVAPKTKLDYLQGKINDYIQKDSRRFLKIIQDELLPAKVLLKKCLEAGLIYRKNDLFYYDGHPMCEVGENSTYTNAARWISDIKRQEVKFALEANLNS